MIITFVLSKDNTDGNNDDKFENEIPDDPTQNTKISFIGFSNYETNYIDGKYHIHIVAWLKRIGGKKKFDKEKKMKMTVIITTSGRLRFLDEVPKEAICAPINPDLDNTMPYNCSVDSEKPVASLEAYPESIKMEGIQLEVSPNAKGQMKNLQNQKDDTLTKFNNGNTYFGTLFKSKLSQEDDNHFKLEGELDDKDFPDDDQLLLTLSKKNKNNEEDNVNMTCNLKKDGKYGTLICEYPKGSGNATLDGIVAIDNKGEKFLTIGMEDSSTELVYGKGVGINNYSRQKSSDGGLSGGAIAGIVIACAVALVAAAITAVICRAPAKPLLKEESKMNIFENIIN